MERQRMKLVRRFFSYYKPHRRLFLMDLVCSFTISMCNMFYPMIARKIMNDYAPNGALRLLIVWAIVLAAIYAVKSILTFVVGTRAGRADTGRHAAGSVPPYRDDALFLF